MASENAHQLLPWSANSPRYWMPFFISLEWNKNTFSTIVEWNLRNLQGWQFLILILCNIFLHSITGKWLCNINTLHNLYGWDNTVGCQYDTCSIRALTIPYVFDTYSIQYTCTWLKVSKSNILDFNNRVNGLGWSIQWIQQILVLKQNNHMCTIVLFTKYMY